MGSFCCFYMFYVWKIFNCFVSLYKELSEPTFSALDNLCEAFACSVAIDFISTMFGFSKVFGW